MESPEPVEKSNESQKLHLLNDNEEYEFTFTKKIEPEVKLNTTPKLIKKEKDEYLENAQEKRQKLNDGNVKKRIRKLQLDSSGGAETPDVADKRKTHTTPKKKTFSIFKIFCCLISVCIVLLAVGSDYVRNQLKENYEKHYYNLVHGNVDYCSQPFDYLNITQTLETKLFGQSVAIQEISKLFESHSEFTSIAFLGNTGVGKTYTTQLIEEKFPWPENVNFYIWTIEAGSIQFEEIKKLMKNFSACGHNALFIDDLAYEDRNYILTINEILKQYAEQNSMKLIVFYVFNLNKHTEMSLDMAKSHAATLHLLNNINIIEFRDLDRNDILKCVDMISEINDVRLTDAQRHDIMNLALKGEIKSGCKNVHAKIALHTKSSDSVKNYD